MFFFISALLKQAKKKSISHTPQRRPTDAFHYFNNNQLSLLQFFQEFVHCSFQLSIFTLDNGFRSIEHINIWIKF